MRLNKIETPAGRALEAVCRRKESQRSETSTPPPGYAPPAGHAVQGAGGPIWAAAKFQAIIPAGVERTRTGRATVGWSSQEAEPQGLAA